MHDVLPAILANDAETFRERLLFSGFWKPGIVAHIDILDGSMFGTTCFCDPAAIHPYTLSSRSPSRLPQIELHCMAQNPVPIIERWTFLVPQTIRAIIHQEINRPLNDVIRRIRELDLEAGLALCPETPVDTIANLSELPDRVLMMGVPPGSSGKPFLGEPILAKIRRLRKKYHDIHISVDGGITRENIAEIIHAGASSLVTASAIWNTHHPKESYEHLIHLS